MRDLQGKVAVVTGASSGIGAATARRLHALGAHVVLGARRGDRLKTIADELGNERVAWAEVDIRSPRQVADLFACAVDAFRRVDCLIANAGVGAYGGILDLSDTEVEEVIDTNLTGTVWSVRQAVPLLTDQGGDIVLVSSVAGLRGRPDEAVYAATKHAVVGLAGSLDRELRPKGVRVTALCPGATDTEFAMGKGRFPDMPELRTMMRAEDVADAIAYALAQPASMRTLLWSMRSAMSEN
ncbi:short-chain dehydrogenase/reductase SDR [Streptomyces albospinus]|uniref:Short-chain dehydrogenase/reductase SDR n=1 Tax=Streptomyces albospinus TaxID=285515 RepID=A0ABQ2UQ49_9ACTN|nr:SDR family oxidoreductase [Streptomyces albospinus]GGU48212.1 short-chain dehydrogenase/reductase SDR [Streptomyces albospinus]